MVTSKDSGTAILQESQEVNPNRAFLDHFGIIPHTNHIAAYNKPNKLVVEAWTTLGSNSKARSAFHSEMFWLCYQRSGNLFQHLSTSYPCPIKMICLYLRGNMQAIKSLRFII